MFPLAKNPIIMKLGQNNGYVILLAYQLNCIKSGDSLSKEDVVDWSQCLCNTLCNHAQKISSPENVPWGDFFIFGFSFHDNKMLQCW